MCVDPENLKQADSFSYFSCVYVTLKLTSQSLMQIYVALKVTSKCRHMQIYIAQVEARNFKELDCFAVLRHSFVSYYLCNLI